MRAQHTANVVASAASVEIDAMQNELLASRKELQLSLSQQRSWATAFTTLREEHSLASARCEELEGQTSLFSADLVTAQARCMHLLGEQTRLRGQLNIAANDSTSRRLLEQVELQLNTAQSREAQLELSLKHQQKLLETHRESADSMAMQVQTLQQRATQAEEHSGSLRARMMLLEDTTFRRQRLANMEDEDETQEPPRKGYCVDKADDEDRGLTAAAVAASTRPTPTSASLRRSRSREASAPRSISQRRAAASAASSETSSVHFQAGSE